MVHILVSQSLCVTLTQTLIPGLGHNGLDTQVCPHPSAWEWDTGRLVHTGTGSGTEPAVPGVNHRTKHFNIVRVHCYIPTNLEYFINFQLYGLNDGQYKKWQWYNQTWWQKWQCNQRKFYKGWRWWMRAKQKLMWEKNDCECSRINTVCGEINRQNKPLPSLAIGNKISQPESENSRV